MLSEMLSQHRPAHTLYYNCQFTSIYSSWQNVNLRTTALALQCTCPQPRQQILKICCMNESLNKSPFICGITISMHPRLYTDQPKKKRTKTMSVFSNYKATVSFLQALLQYFSSCENLGLLFKIYLTENKDFKMGFGSLGEHSRHFLEMVYQLTG